MASDMGTVVARARMRAMPARRDARRQQGRMERMVFGVPARFMVPRLILGATVLALLAFGLLMIFSASSIVALTSSDTNHNPAYYLQRQLAFVAFGLVLSLVVARLDYHLLTHRLLRGLWVGSLALLVLIFTPVAGLDAYGASRWISIGSFTLQPSEFAKVVVVLTAANVATQYYDEQTIDFDQFVKLMAGGVGIPLALILLQPDKGTTMICVATLMVMGYLAGVPARFLGSVAVAGLVIMVALSLKDDYSRRRLMSMIDPWADPFGASYQLVQGFYAFGSGGLLGVGVGLSRQKYSYLPFAYNDFIYAVVGEELGLAGTLGVLAAFALLAWAGFEIARYAPDMAGRLVAAGSTSMLIIQLLVNVCGVLGIIPLSGKPVPFLSYGGSSVISCLLLVGLVASVSRASRLPETEFDQRRGRVGLAPGASGPLNEVPALSLVGEPTLRSQRRTSAAASAPLVGVRGLAVHAGGRSGIVDDAEGDDNPLSPASIRARQRLAERAGGRVSTDARGRRRIDLGPDAASRLRGRR